MFVLLLLSGIAFIPRGESIKCIVDSEGGEVTCEPEMTHCGVTRTMAYDVNSTLKTDKLLRICIKADNCRHSSFHDGKERQYLMVQCCDKDLCNYVMVPPAAPRNPEPNGVTCSYCSSPEGRSCKDFRKCTGNQTHCYTGRNFERGCASETFCEKPLLSERLIGYFKCCKGDLCNSSSRASACVLLLIAAVTSILSST